MASGKRPPILLSEASPCHHCGQNHELTVVMFEQVMLDGKNCYALCPVTGAPLTGTLTLSLDGGGDKLPLKPLPRRTRGSGDSDADGA